MYYKHNALRETHMGVSIIRIDDTLEKDLEALAKSQHRSKSDLARDMLRKRIAVERFRRLRTRALRPDADFSGYQCTRQRPDNPRIVR